MQTRYVKPNVAMTVNKLLRSVVTVYLSKVVNIILTAIGREKLIIAYRIRISEILPWDRKSYPTHAILPRTPNNVIM